jgi:hypothetical protein
MIQGSDSWSSMSVLMILKLSRLALLQEMPRALTAVIGNPP